MTNEISLPTKATQDAIKGDTSYIRNNLGGDFSSTIPSSFAFSGTLWGGATHMIDVNGSGYLFHINFDEDDTLSTTVILDGVEIKPSNNSFMIYRFNSSLEVIATRDSASNSGGPYYLYVNYALN
jgi:hypothetical protein